MNKNNKIVAPVVNFDGAKMHAETAKRAMQFLFMRDIGFKKKQRNNPDFKKESSMISLFTKKIFLLLGALVLSVNASAGINWVMNYADNAAANSGSHLGRVEVSDSGGWASGAVNYRVWASGGCGFVNNATNSSQDTGTVSCSTTWSSCSVSATVQLYMRAGSVSACNISANTDSNGTQSKKYYVKQIVTLNNPGSRDDVDPDYTIYASAKTVDGLASTLNSTNKLTFVSSTIDKCTIVSTDINSAVVRHKPGVSGVCTVTAYAAGDTNILPADSGAVSWQIVNTQFPQLALVSPLTKGLKPSFIFSSTQASMPGTYIEVLGACGPAPSNKAAVLGNNAFRFKQLTLGATYSNCQIKVTNEIDSGYLNIPAFTVVENLDGPGGIGGTDGATSLMLWLNGANLPGSGTVATWLDQSGRDIHFSGGGGQGTFADPFTSIQNARDRAATPGIYYFNLAGNTFTTQVDKDGYVLVASAKGATNGAYPAAGTDALTFQSDAVLKAAILTNLGAINEVRMNVNDGANAGFNVTTTNTTIINRVKGNLQLPNNNDVGGITWSGNTSFLTSSCTSGGGYGAALTSKVYHACGNSSGMHWLQVDSLEKVNYGSTNTNLNLWVRAPSALAQQPGLGTLNGFPVATFNGDLSNTTGQFLLNSSANLNARSLFIVYKDTSTVDYATPFSSTGQALLHGRGGAASPQPIYEAVYTPDWTDNSPTNTGAQTWVNNVDKSVSPWSNRPANYEIHSHIFGGNYANTGAWYLGRDPDFGYTRLIKGGIAELLVFSNAINMAQRTILENYLFAKYSDGTNVALTSPLYTYGGISDAYKYEMAGIGKATDGSVHLSAKGSLVQINNPVGMATNTYVMWAHNNDALTFSNTDVPALISQRLARKWKVRNSGVTSMDLTFHIADIPGYLSMCFDPNSLRLLIDADGVFGAGATIKSGVFNASNQTVTFTNVTIANGNYLAFGVGGSASNIYVTVKGAGNKDGSNWANACTLEGAVNSPRVIGDVIKLAQGVYKPSATMYIYQPITIIGGYEGLLTSEVSTPDTYLTVVSGDKDNDDETLSNIIMYHRDIRGTNLDRLFNITNVGSAVNPVTLQGFFVTGMSQFGGHGAAVWQQNSTVNYNKMKFYGNRAREMGGSLLVYNNSVANITDSIFLGNVGEEGGAINAHVNSTIKTTNSQFINNETMLLANRSASSNVTLAGSQALNFNGAAWNGGTANQVTTSACAAGTGLPTNNFTYEAWIKPTTTITMQAQSNSSTTGTAGQAYVFGAYNRGTDGGSGLSVGTNGIQVYEHGAGYLPPLASKTIAVTGWNHIAIVYSSKAPKIYLNGNWVHDGLVSPKGTVYAPCQVGMGDYGSFAGQIDEVRVWSVARTQQQIQDNMYKELGDPLGEGSLAYYWKFNNNVLDSSPNGLNGTMSPTAPTYVAGTVVDPYGSGSGPKWNRFAGGAIDANSGSILNITTTQFIGNNAQNLDYSLGIQGFGGAISLSQNSADNAAANGTALTVTSSSFSFNASRDGGGAIYAMPGFNSMTISKSSFKANSATRPYTATPESTSYWGSGGAIHAMGSPTVGQAVVNITDTEFEQNSAKELGGAVYFNGASIYSGAPYIPPVNSYLTATIDRSAFIGNTAGYGGGLLSWMFNGSNNQTTINNSTFTGNVTTGWGGGIGSAWGARVTVNQSTIYNNYSGTGGGLQLHGTGAGLTAGTLVLSKNIILDNVATTAGRGTNIDNVIAMTDSGYNLIGYNGSSGWYNNGVLNPVPGGTSFTSPATLINQILDTILDYRGGLTRNYGLSSNGGAGSSAFNKIPIASCLPAYDQRNAARVSSGGFTKCDIGAYESNKTDSDGDSIVDAVDNCPGISNYGTPQADTDTDNLGDSCDPDIDGDGVVNANDAYPYKTLGGRLDSDQDGYPDTCDAACVSPGGMTADTDNDNDGVPNIADNCLSKGNIDQNNIDADAYGDACDDDLDGDGVNNTADNCPSISNPLQTDSDGNGLGNDCNAVFVKVVASGLGDGSSWSNAYGGGTGVQLQAALDDAFNVKRASLVYLAKGIYRPSATVKPYKGMQLYGGFAGNIDEVYSYQANPVQNVTIITGDTGADDVVDSSGITQSYNDQRNTNLGQIIDTELNGATAYGDVITFTGITLTGAGSNSALHLKNSRIRLKNVNFIGNKGVSGAGLFMEQNSFAIVSDSIFRFNKSTTSGGAVYITGAAGIPSEISFINTEFSSNQADVLGAGTVGGAISVLTNVKANISNSLLFDNHSVDSGGAIHGDSFNTLYITGTTLSGNSTTSTTTTLGGGAIRIKGSFNSAYLGASDVLSNSSASQGAGLMVSSTATAANGLAKAVMVEDTLFKTNTTTGGSAVGGGAIATEGTVGATTLTVSRSSFISNSSVKGGAIYLAGGDVNDLLLDNSTFYDNRSSGNGGAIALNSGADATVSYVTLLQNIATGHGGGIRVDPVDTSSVLNIKTSLIVGNTSTASSGGSNISINYTGSGGYTDGGYNLIGYGAATGLFAANVNNATPALPSKKAIASSIDAIITPALTDYSGVHKSIALTATSEARDVIPNGALYNCVTDAGYDERGFERPDMVDVTDPDQKNDVRKCDIGAFEFNNAYRIDCFAEDGLRPDKGTGYGYYYCEDGTKPSAGELANNVFVGRVDYYMLLLMFMLGFVRVKKQQIRS